MKYVWFFTQAAIFIARLINLEKAIFKAENADTAEDIAQYHRWHWTYICGKQIQGKKVYPS